MRKFSIEFKWGVIFTLASLLWMLLEKSVGLHDVYINKQLIYTNLFAFVAITIYVLALRDKKQHYYHGQMNWTQGFLSGLIISIFVACLSPLAQYITYTYISPDYFTNMIAYRVSNGYHTPEKAQAYFNINNFLYKDAIPAISMGVVTASVVALFLQTKSTVK